MAEKRKETDSLGVVEVRSDKLWGAQTQRSLEHFSIGHDLIPREMIAAYAILKKAAAIANHAGKRLDDQRYKLIVRVCDEILAGRHRDMFPLHVWMTGSGTQFNMNVNEVISNRCSQIAGTRSAATRRSIPTITSTWPSRPTTPFLPPCASPLP
jgi:fumarate hydratase, class II